MNITPDFSEATESKSGPVPNGVYKARVGGVEEKTSKAGNPYLSWNLVIFGAEGDAASQNNRIIWHRTMTSGKAAFMLRDFMKATKTELPKAGASFNAEDLVGKELEIVVQETLDQNGQTSQYSEVKAVKPLQF